MAETRFVLCENCQSEGRIYRGRFDEIDQGECPVCEGRGMMEVEVFPVTLEDLGAAT